MINANILHEVKNHLTFDFIVKKKFKELEEMKDYLQSIARPKPKTLRDFGCNLFFLVIARKKMVCIIRLCTLPFCRF